MHASAIRSRSLVVGLIPSLLVATLVSAGLDWQRSNDVARRIESQGVQTVFVVEGDTLWTLAQEHGIDGVRTSDVVSWTVEHNGLSTSMLRPGQRLELPAGSRS